MLIENHATLEVREDEDGWGLVPTEADLLEREQQDACFDESPELYELWWSELRGRPPGSLDRSQIRPLVYQGVPMKFRHELWLKWLRCAELARAHPPTYLATLRARAAAAGETEATRQVDLDVNRTLPTLLSPSHLERLREVLILYSHHNPALGYCQSMNFLCGILLLLGLSNEDCFWALAYLVEQFCDGYHSVTLHGLLRDVAVAGELLQRLQPELNAKLQALKLPVLWLAVDAFLCLYAKSVPLRALLRIWDVLLFEGPRALFAIFLTFLEVNESVFLAAPARVLADPDACVHETVAAFAHAQARTAALMIPHVLEKAGVLLEDGGVLTAELVQQLRSQVSDQAQQDPVQPAGF
jgi:hypothetical protein